MCFMLYFLPFINTGIFEPPSDAIQEMLGTLQVNRQFPKTIRLYATVKEHFIMDFVMLDALRACFLCIIHRIVVIQSSR